MRRLSILGLMSAVLLAACGGGNTITGKATGTTTGTPTVAAVTVTSSVPQIAADGTTSALISNATVSGAAVTFSASAGTVAVTQATTDTNGLATATLNASGVAAGTSITVTAAAAGASGKVIVAVVAIKENISLTTSLAQIPSDGSKSATLTALVKDANNNFLSGVTVGFVPTSGGVTVTQATTNASGVATATLTSGNDPSNRTITVTATAGTASATVPVQVTGTTLAVTGPPTLVLGAVGTYTVSATNSANVGVANVTVALASSLGNTLSGASVVTDTTGHQTFTVTASKSGADTITATALGGTATQAINVSAQSFQFTTPAATSGSVDVKLGAAQTLAVTWTANGVPQANQTINFSASRGALSASTAVTNAAGTASVTITSAAAGPASVTASVLNPTTQQVLVSAQQNLEFIATTPTSIDVQASPATIPTLGQSTITATVRDANDNLVENQTVSFAIAQVTTTGGTLSVPSAITDSQGRAQTVYTASSTPSKTNGVVITASVPAAAAVTPQSVDLTVGGLAVGLSLGTGNKLTENTAQTQFIVPYIVDAVDSAGNPVPNAVITLAIHAVTYYKGTYVKGATQWNWTPTVGCPNEDLDLSGIYTQPKDGIGPTTAPLYNAFGNGNGKLDPGATANADPASVTTGADGSAAFNVVYPEDIANWDIVELTASTSVSGTEATASTTFQLPILASYITTLTSSPPGYISPYGVATVCTNPN